MNEGRMMAAISDKQPRGRGRGRPFQPGQSGNPRGRPRGLTEDVRLLAQRYTPEALAALVSALQSKGERVAAATVLLNRGWGLPKQALQVDHTLLAQADDATLLAIALSGGSAVAVEAEDAPQRHSGGIVEGLITDPGDEVT